MAKTLLSQLQTLWPFSLFKVDEIKASSRLVHKLPIPNATKEFTFALQDPSSQTVVYILAVQNLSEKSSLDAECLIKSVQPDAVVVQVPPSALPEIQTEDKLTGFNEDAVPTSTLGVLRKCFLDKINKQEFENVAGNLILREIFGVGFYGHLLAAKRAAETVNSKFLLLASPYENVCVRDSKAPNHPFLPFNSLIHVRQTSSKINTENTYDYQAPWFARTIYSLLADLHDIFSDSPALGNALLYAQKLLANINEGESVDTQHVSEVRNFRVAVEGLRIALNGAARNNTKEIANPALEFDELPAEEKCHALLAQGLKHQAKGFKTMVAVVDAGSLLGIRQHWNTSLPSHVMELAAEGVTRYDDDNDYDDDIEHHTMEHEDKKKLLRGKPVVAVGAGMTAFLGATSFSKAIHASTLAKIIAYKLPLSLKVSVAAFQRTTALGLTKILGVVGSGTKASALKVTASSEKIRALTHSVVASAERTSLLAMRTSFYEIMRKGKVQPARVSPWLTFGFSMVSCAGLLAYGDGIECAAESVPSAPMIASLGRGLQSLHKASQQVSHSNTNNNSKRLQDSLQSLMYSLKRLDKSQ